MALQFSVVVCTRNRQDLLRVALESLARQDYPRDRFEVIVVDNDSTDETPVVTEEFSRRCGNVRHILEKKLGHCNARNRGWREATGHYVAYVDDDCKMPPQWLAVAQSIVEEIGPGAFGGPYHPFTLTRKPIWFKSDYYSSDRGFPAETLTGYDCFRLTGGNLFVRRDLLESLGGFDPKLGMRGKVVGYGDETDLLRRIRDERPDEIIYYDPAVYLFHLARAEKLTLRWKALRYLRSGRYAYKSKAVSGQTGRSPIMLLRDLGWLLRRLVRDCTLGAIQRDRRKYPLVQNYLCEEAFRTLWTVGKTYEHLRDALRRNRSGARRTEETHG